MSFHLFSLVWPVYCYFTVTIPWSYYKLVLKLRVIWPNRVNYCWPTSCCVAWYDDIHIMFETMQTIYLAWPLQIELCPDFISLLLSKSEVTNSDCLPVECFLRYRYISVLLSMWPSVLCRGWTFSKSNTLFWLSNAVKVWECLQLLVLCHLTYLNVLMRCLYSVARTWPDSC